MDPVQSRYLYMSSFLSFSYKNNVFISF